MKRYKNRGFTLVEVLICVGIVGIIAAITIPTLLSSTSEKALETQRKALYSRMAQAMGQIKNLGAYKLINADHSASGFVLALSKVYKIKSVCQPGGMKQCGIPDEVLDFYNETNEDGFKPIERETIPQLNDNVVAADIGNHVTKYVGFKTANGESILLYYNPECKAKNELPHKLIDSVCVNMIYDLNGGENAPNAYGEDIGYMTVFYPTDSILVAPILYNKESFSGSYSQMLAKAQELDLVPPTIEELISILLNKDITILTKNSSDALSIHWSSSYAVSDTETKIWVAGIEDGVLPQSTKTGSGSDREYSYYLIKK